jgi:FMN phosphatase YigB (HAD superfamily)
MRNSILDNHKTIAWDIDETLVNGPNSRFFRDYIRSNPDKIHHLVTFRTPRSWAEEALDQLRDHGLDPALITGVSSVPVDLFTAFAGRHDCPDHPLLDDFAHWKGMEAARLGCTVLVDDMEDFVIRGCNRHGVTFVHAHHECFSVELTTA